MIIIEVIENLCLEELLPTEAKEDVSKILKKYGLSIPEDFRFSSKTNIIIGSNGSGKTRFLNALKELYSKSEKIRVMYGYFPSLSHCVNSKCEGDELPPFTLYEYLTTKEAKFDDLFDAIESYGQNFLLGLFQYRSKMQKELLEKIWKELSADFLKLTSKQLVNYENDIFLQNSAGEKIPLVEECKAFSPGELMLLYISIFLSLQRNSRQEELIIILDEPESHLHPKALLEFIRSLVLGKYANNVWIATHSLFLLPEFDFDNIVYINNGKIEGRKSTLYTDVLSDVLGENNKKSSDFFASLSSWQYCEFMAECFTNPTVINTVNPRDEQVVLFKRFLQTYKNSRTPIRILDYGGGSARLGLSLKASDPLFENYISYEILDKHPTYFGSKFKVFKDTNEIDKLYDCIVLMNVLHEVDPKDWPEFFKGIFNLMKDRAYLVFVEVSALTYGEMPNKVGYLVLGKEELKILFGSDAFPSEIKLRTNQKSVCFVIQKMNLKNVTSETVNKAIKHLKEHSYGIIKNLRNVISNAESEEKARMSRQYAFWTQQYINAKIYDDSNPYVSSEKAIEGFIKAPMHRFVIDPEENEVSFFIAPEKEMLIKELLDSKLIRYSTHTGIRTVRNYLLDALNCPNKKGSMFKKYMNSYWDSLLKIEHQLIDKTVVAIFLKSAILMGDDRSKEKFENGNYKNYLSGYVV